MLVNCFNSISLPRKSWVGISDCPATNQLEDPCRMARNLCVALGVHQDNISVCFISPYTPLLYSTLNIYLEQKYENS